MIKKILSVLGAALLLITSAAWAQGQQAKPFVIKGTLSGAENGKVSLINVDDNKRIDKTSIVDGSFILKGAAKGPSVFAIKFKEDALPLLLVMNGGDSLQIKTTAAAFPVGTVTGNKQSEEMQRYQHEFAPLIQKAQSINQRARDIDPSDSSASLALQQEANDFNNDMQSTGVAFVQYHPDALASIFVLMNELHNIPPPQLQKLYQSLSEEVKKSRYGQMARAAITRVAYTSIGAPAPNFTLKDVNGNSVSLSSFRGKYVLVDFWASWCGPCRAENPNVVKAYKRFKDNDFTVLGVSLDKSKESWMKAIHQDGLQWTQVSDLKGWNNTAAELYHVRSIPSNFLIDPSGKIIAKNLRGRALENKLSSIF